MCLYKTSSVALIHFLSSALQPYRPEKKMNDRCKQPCVCPQVLTVLYLPTVSTVSVNIVGPLQTDLCLPLVRYPVSTFLQMHQFIN